MSPALNLVALVAATIELGLCGYYYCAAYDTARDYLPGPLRGRMSTRIVLDRFIFRAAVPQAARHDYLVAHVFGCVAFVSLAILAFASGPPAGGYVFVALALLALGQTFMHWRKDRRLRHGKVSPPVAAL
jgi:hypothetical protein